MLAPAGALSVTAVEGLPEVVPGDDLAALIASAIERQPRKTPPLTDTDVLVTAHKVVSKAEGRLRVLADVRPGERAVQLATELGKDPRHVQVVLDESREVRRASHGVLICVTHHGFVCANAGVDASNVPGEDTLVLLPRDPDASARTLRARIRDLTNASPAVLITDSFGRAWRRGQVDVAIGCAGLSPLEDWRGRTDTVGRELKATWIAIADELAAAADLARTKDGALPVVVVRGADRHVSAEDGPGAAALIRPESEDLFR
ncbi:MAG TPA: coenzyme F420-0:L-glutamate ligase [Solirubrobacteraceae bacterium]|nr:coenzyme F420-0:L-glutamate ligase [Solirubrobacteraceae bacterium]